jgi:Anti-sigma factor NepR
MSEKTSGRSRKKPAKAAASPGAPSGVDQFIAGQLKAIYDEVAAEPVPDRLLQLLERLDRGGKS